MEVGVNLPTDLPGMTGDRVLEWARRADEGPFSTLGVTDRVVWNTFEPFAVLAAAGAATRRVRLMTIIAIAPLRAVVWLAKMAATVDALSGGRLTLGLGLGAREDDYAAVHADWHSRGRRFEELLSELRSYWEEGSSVGPRPERRGGPQILVGGVSDVAFSRMARYADGYVHGGGPPKGFARVAEKARAAWVEAGRPGRPKLSGHGYFALGGDSKARAGVEHVRRYYAFLGPYSEKIAEGVLTTPQAVVQFVRGYEEAGCDELLLFPTVGDLSELDRLADVVSSL